MTEVRRRETWPLKDQARQASRYVLGPMKTTADLEREILALAPWTPSPRA